MSNAHALVMRSVSGAKQQTWPDTTTGDEQSCLTICDTPNPKEKTCESYCSGK